jgi:predicted small secreted protein
MMKRTAAAAAVLLLGAASLTACKGAGITDTCHAAQTLTRGSGGHGSHGSRGRGVSKSKSKSKTHRGGAGHVPRLHRSDMDDSCDD